MLPLELWYEIYDKLDDKSLTNLLDVSREWHHQVRYYIIDAKKLEEVMRYDIVLFKKYWDGKKHNKIIGKGCSTEVLSWLRDNECPMDRNTLCHAALNGSLENMIWLKKNGCLWDEYTFCAAALNGSLKNMIWLKENDCPMSTNVFSFAIKNGSLENIVWLKENGCLWDKYVFDRAIDSGNMKIIEWLFKNGCPYSHFVGLRLEKLGLLEN